MRKGTWSSAWLMYWNRASFSNAVVNTNLASPSPCAQKQLHGRAQTAIKLEAGMALPEWNVDNSGNCQRRWKQKLCFTIICSYIFPNTQWPVKVARAMLLSLTGENEQHSRSLQTGVSGHSCTEHEQWLSWLLPEVVQKHCSSTWRCFDGLTKYHSVLGAQESQH